MARKLFLGLLLAVLPALTLPGAASASRSQESLFQDDTSLLNSPQLRDQTLDELQSLGVDVIRVNVVWNRYAPDPSSSTKPRFDAEDPAAYPLGSVDAVVEGARQRGMDVLLTPTGPSPAWASECSGSATFRRICRPNPADFGRFVTALGRRYSGSFNSVPRVSRWSIWNEPNLAAWLYPQWSKKGSTYVPESPIRYRMLVRAATAALAATGHGGDQVLLGETAPLGRTSGTYATRSLGPVAFYRELFCLDSRGRALTGTAAKVRGCNPYQRLAVTGVAHHPYTRGGGSAPTVAAAPNDITLATISRLGTWIDRGAARGRIPRGLPIWLTEYGFQTRPPDPFLSVPLSIQGQYLNQSDWMAWNNPRIRSVAQYELRDEADLGAFQTGLRFVGGRAKPGLAAYRLPLWVVGTRTNTKIWLQVRPESRLGPPQTVTVQYLPSARSKSYKTLGTYAVGDPHGFRYFRTGVRAAYWRFTWKSPGGATLTSRKAAPAAR